MQVIEIFLIISYSFSFVGSRSPYSARIINGIEAPITYPWIARIVIDYTRTEDKLLLMTNCGGSLIAPQWILTAKHCLLDANLNALKKEFHVSIGNNNYVQGQLIKCTDYFFYSTNTQDINDIALLKLEKIPDINKPIPILFDDTIDLDGKIVTIYGWGQTQSGNPNTGTMHLHTAEIQLKTMIQGLNNVCRNDSVCFDPTITIADSGVADSGGPMTLNIDGVDTLIGVAHSWETLQPIHGNSFVISTYIKTFFKPYANWIKKTIAKN